MEIITPTPHVQGFVVRPWCWIVERTLGWLGRQRRLSKDYERKVQTSETLLKLAMIRLMVRRLAGARMIFKTRSKGRMDPPEALARHFSQALFPRRTNRYGCVTLHSYHFYVEAGLPQTQVLLWVSGEQLRAAFDHVILAEYHCRYDWRERKVKEVRQGVFYPTRFASPQGMLIPLTSQDALVVYRARAARRRPPSLPSTPQLLLFEVVPTQAMDGSFPTGVKVIRTSFGT